MNTSRSHRVLPGARVACAILALPATLIAAPHEASASNATIDVTTNQDNSTNDTLCTLREAITAANSQVNSYRGCTRTVTGTGNATTITLHAETYALGSTLPTVVVPQSMTTTANDGLLNATQANVLETPDQAWSLVGFRDTRTLTNASTPSSWGTPNSNATVYAASASISTRRYFFSYPKGASMFGLVAPAGRVGFFASDAAVPSLNAPGWRLFREALIRAAQ